MGLFLAIALVIVTCSIARNEIHERKINHEKHKMEVNDGRK